MSKNVYTKECHIKAHIWKNICHHWCWWVYRFSEHLVFLWKFHDSDLTVGTLIFTIHCSVLTACLLYLCFQRGVVGCWLKWVVSYLVQVSQATTLATWTAPGKSPCQLDMVSSMDVRAFQNKSCHFLLLAQLFVTAADSLYVCLSNDTCAVK